MSQIVDDYINWAYSMLGNNIESEEICINEEIFDLAYDIYHIVASLDYTEELMEWYEISEMIDSINYNTFYNEYFTRSDVEEKIIQQAKLQIESLSG